MDDPVQLYKVLIDIRQVAVELDTATKQSSNDSDDQWDDNYNGQHRNKDNKSVIWDTLAIKPGVYDLLKLRNGTDTLLASGLFPSGKILKVKITLGSGNTVYTDSATYFPLQVYGSSPSVTINLRREHVSSVSSNDFKLWLDFNLEKSIFFRNGTFVLKPNIVGFNDVVKAKLEGKVLPEHGAALVVAYNSKDTLYSIPNDDGKYQFRGVTAGTYSLHFKGTGGFRDTTINHIVVDSMKVVEEPTITLHR
jgi:hypothetical protein